jgi:hypothetical protein
VRLGMPVFGCDFEGEGEIQQFIDCGYGVPPAGDCQGAVLW